VTTSRVAYVDVVVLRLPPRGVEVLVLRRAAAQARAGSWETVSGHLHPGETPVAAARRELAEETGCAPLRLYNLSRVEQFYLHATDEIVLIPMFVAFVAPDAEVGVGPEHDRGEWLTPALARERVTWPRAARAIEDACRLLATGDAGLVERELRID
jgi:8-oxo-dGTP pyrophosphatase MutT (NUDIX family)